MPASDYPRSQFPDAVSWLVDEERRASFEGATEALAWDDPARPRGEHFESISYLTLMYLPPAERVSRFEGLFFESSGDASSGSYGRSKTSGWRRALRLQPRQKGRSEAKDDGGEPRQDAEIRGKRGGYREHLDRFVQETDRAIDLLSSVLPEIASLDDKDTLTYLHSCVSTKRHQVGVPEIPAYLDAYICDEPLTAGLSPALGRSHGVELVLVVEESEMPDAGMLRNRQQRVADEHQ